MPKLDIRTLPLPETVRETKTFTDPLQPGAELTLTLELTPDYSQVIRARAHADKRAKERGEGAVVPVAGRAIQPISELCRAIGLIESVECPADPKDRYSFEEWVGISYLMPNAFADIVAWSNTLLDKAFSGQKDLMGGPSIPNDSAAREGDTSEPPQNTALPLTPTKSRTKAR
jgi:hypothetical protein